MIGAVDLGGSHVRAGLVVLGAGDTGARVVSSASAPLHAGASREEVLETLVRCMTDAGHGPDVDGWAVAAPGPFDYAAGIARVRGLAKLESIHGVDLRRELADRLALHGDDLVFLNDAHAFGLGEWSAGAARGRPRVVALTLGTGLGSVFLEHGRAVVDGRVPPDGYLGLVAHGTARLDDLVSTRGFQRAAGSDLPVRDLAERARGGDAAALRAFDTVCDDLVAGMQPWIERFAPSDVVVGGSIAKAWDLLEPRLSGRFGAGTGVHPSLLGADAPLIGAASHLFADVPGRRLPPDRRPRRSGAGRGPGSDTRARPAASREPVVEGPP